MVLDFILIYMKLIKKQVQATVQAEDVVVKFV